MKKIQPEEIEELNKRFLNASAEEILEFSYERLGEGLAMTSSFQTQSVSLLYLISQICPSIPILFLDTGFHFKETLQFRDDLISRLHLNVINLVPKIGHQAFLETYGKLYTKDPDKCCFINKTEPLKAALSNYDAWLTGVRKDQTIVRSELNVFNLQRNGKVKICPIISWTKRKLWTFHNQHNLPDHPLMREGYISIGCAPCTRCSFNDNERSGRWRGMDKTECGIHTDI